MLDLTLRVKCILSLMRRACTMKQIKIQTISFAYDEEDVIEKLSLTIPCDGGCIILAGKNGSGKSTMLQLLCGSLRPYAGKIERDQICMGYLPFESPLFEQLSVLDNLRYYYRNFHGKNFNIEDAHVQKILNQLQIDYLEQRLDKCSSGQRQKAGIAMILLSGADVIIMDEPFVAIDAKSTQGLLRLLSEMKKDTTFLLTTHAISQLVEITDRLLLLKDKQIVQDTKDHAFIQAYFRNEGN